MDPMQKAENPMELRYNARLQKRPALQYTHPSSSFAQYNSCVAETTIDIKYVYIYIYIYNNM